MVMTIIRALIITMRAIMIIRMAWMTRKIIIIIIISRRIRINMFRSIRRNVLRSILGRIRRIILKRIHRNTFVKYSSRFVKLYLDILRYLRYYLVFFGILRYSSVFFGILRHRIGTILIVTKSIPFFSFIIFSSLQIIILFLKKR